MQPEEIVSLSKSLHFLGEVIPIYRALTPGDKTEAVMDQGRIVITYKTADASLETIPDAVFEKAIEAFLSKQCKRLVQSRIAFYQPKFKVKPKKVTIEKSFNKWGSCNAQKELTFNYLLVTKPLEALDYVVVHELCHLSHLNHDRSFWRLLGSVLPNYKETEKLLSLPR